MLFAALGTSFLVLYCFYGASLSVRTTGEYWRRFFGLFGILAAVGFAAFAIGGVLGFLFGIPKLIPTKDIPADAEQALAPGSNFQRLYRSNTNLEEMSDWLTKLIIGAGLVQFNELGRYFEKLVSRIAESLDSAPFASTITGSVIVGFLILGFFTVYLLARLFLAGAFSRAEESFFIRSFAKAQTLANLNLSDLSIAEKKALVEILDARAKGGSFTLPSNFVRGTPEHEALRSLKERLLIRPREGGSWQPGKTVELTPIAEQISDKLKKEIEKTPEHKG